MDETFSRGADTRACRVETRLDAFRALLGTVEQMRGNPIAFIQLLAVWEADRRKKRRDAADTSVRATGFRSPLWR
jgi:hypothetical protein